MTPSGIKHATFWLVAQCLNQTALPAACPNGYFTLHKYYTDGP